MLRLLPSNRSVTTLKFPAPVETRVVTRWSTQGLMTCINNVLSALVTLHSGGWLGSTLLDGGVPHKAIINSFFLHMQI